MTTESLFSSEEASEFQPLAARVRPRSLEQYIGQKHLLAPNKPLRSAIESGQLHSMILWGPPGVGKTTLARLFANHTDAEFVTISAVLSGVKDIRAAVEAATQHRQLGQKTVLFVDEVHRFNKAQQDAFLPYLEDGTIIFIGATTENPSFELNNALLSRARVYVLKSLTDDELRSMLNYCLDNSQYGLGSSNLSVNERQLNKIIQAADGDGRRAINLLEICSDLAVDEGDVKILSDATVDAALAGLSRRFDKQGEHFYDQISALHKSVRGSDPDAALYWLARMLDGGCDALYIARRVVRMASEDIGNADPRALQIALNAWDVQHRLGSPEGELALAQAVVYLAAAAKSNAVYTAFKAAQSLVASEGSEEVPMHLRNAPTALMKDLGYGGEYRYAHDEPGGFAAGENYFPEALRETELYHPVERGLEQQIKTRLAHYKALNQTATWQRYGVDADSNPE